MPALTVITVASILCTFIYFVFIRDYTRNVADDTPKQEAEARKKEIVVGSSNVVQVRSESVQLPSLNSSESYSLEEEHVMPLIRCDTSVIGAIRKSGSENDLATCSFIDSDTDTRDVGQSSWDFRPLKEKDTLNVGMAECYYDSCTPDPITQSLASSSEDETETSIESTSLELETKTEVDTSLKTAYSVSKDASIRTATSANEINSESKGTVDDDKTMVTAIVSKPDGEPASAISTMMDETETIVELIQEMIASIDGACSANGNKEIDQVDQENEAPIAGKMLDG